MSWSSLLTFHTISQLVMMAGLLLASSFCSASETAFFNLSGGQLRRWANSPATSERLVAFLMAHPNRFLTALLFSNMVVNVFYFAVSSVLSYQISRMVNPIGGAATAALSFFVLLLLGEIVPKSIAYTYSCQISLLAAPACFVLFKVLSPFLQIIDTVFIKPLTRLFSSRSSQKSGFSAAELKILLDNSRREGLLAPEENVILSEILEFAYLKVRHLMTPRVQMLAVSETMSNEQIQRLLVEHQLTKAPLYRQSIDHIVGIIHLRDLMLNPHLSASQLKKTVMYVPEQKTIESLIADFQKHRQDFAVVVDEYGGISGQITLDDVISDLLAPLRNTAQLEIEPLGPLSYRLSGDLAIHEWVDAFGIDLEQTQLTTLGGFVTALLGKIPRIGDKVRWKNMTFTVETMDKHRIRTIVLDLEPLQDLQTMSGKAI